MNVEKVVFEYDFLKLKTTLLTYINDEKGVDELIDFIKNSILYGAFSSLDLIKKTPYDFSISKELIEELSKSLDKEELFTEEVKECLKDKNFIGIDVEYEDYETSEFYSNETFEISDVDVQLYPTFPIFESYYEKVENIFEGNDDFEDKKWSITEEIERFNSFYKEKYLEHNVYQYGGNMTFSTQGEYENFIGSYFGEYGDAGSVYVFVENNNVISTVDMF